MNQTQATEKKSKKIEHVTEDVAADLSDRVEHVRDLVETVREKAEVAFRDKPYLVPVAAGVLGLGIGVLLGSKLTRFIVFTAVGGILSETLGGEIKRIAGDFVSELQRGAADGDASTERAEAHG